LFVVVVVVVNWSVVVVAMKAVSEKTLWEVKCSKKQERDSYMLMCLSLLLLLLLIHLLCFDEGGVGKDVGGSKTW